jgi:uncharacterized protein YqjF (DUF2071 family)
MWITRQRWECLYFLHFAGDSSLIRKILPDPLELDEWQGRGVLSIVPFRMTRIQFPFVPILPKLSNLWELNLRTYVKYKNQTGIYFITLESDNPIATWVANQFFHLPYRNAKMQIENTVSHLKFSHVRQKVTCHLEILNTNNVDHSTSSFSKWATNRYCLFNVHKQRVYRGVVDHPPWNLTDAKVLNYAGTFLEQVPGANSFVPIGASYNRQIDVSFNPFQKL